MSVSLVHPLSRQKITVADSRVPAYKDQGWRVAEPDAPSASATKADWVAFAKSRGFSDADIEGKTRAELRAALA